MTNLFTREERTLLGHHVEPQTKSATIYNRDSQIMLQYKVLKLINLIRTKKLKPGASRAERLAMLVENGSTGDPSELAEVVQEPEIEASDEDSQDVDLHEEDDPTTDLDSHLDAEREKSRNKGTSSCGTFIASLEWFMQRRLCHLRIDCYVAGLSLSIWLALKSAVRKQELA